ncbi:ABC transporter substrate-binding protein [Natronorubrum bangense]|nr:ABC transporter substrate-binding protein [Natronorubrum bangense]
MRESRLSRRTYLKGAAALSGVSMTAGCALLDEDLGQETIEGIPDEPFRIVQILFESGPAAFYGEQAMNATDMLVEQINAEGGLLGEREIEIVDRLDEGAGLDSLISEVQAIAQEGEVDMLFSIISSAHVLGVAPAANDQQMPFLVTMPGTYQLFEENPEMDHVVRTAGSNAAGAIGAVRMAEQMDDVETVVTIDPDYAWGHDHQEMFETALGNVRPDIDIVESRYPDLGETDYSAHVSAIASEEPDLLFSSLWGGDTATFVSQGVDGGLFDQIGEALLIGDTGAPLLRSLGGDMPENVWLGGRAGYQPTYRYDEDEDHQQFVDDYYDRYGEYPGWGAYHDWAGLKTLQEGVERAVSIIGDWPTGEQLMASMNDISVEMPHGQHTMRGPQAAAPAVFGRPTEDHDFPVDHPLTTDFEFIAATEVNPPTGVPTMEWVEEIEPL